MMLDARFTLYYPDDRHASNPIFDCIYAYLDDNVKYVGEPITRNYHLIPYCRRPDFDETQEETGNLDINHNQMIRFTELKKRGVTSAQLLTWMAPIDVAERYEKDDGSSHEIFYNCSPPWFGSICQYKFDYDTSFLFRDIVRATFESRSKLCKSMENNICYPFLPDCYRGPSPICLDWREICDGKFDCINGEDEKLCEQLEINECNEDEYRCHFGGQCIPLAFLGDGRTNVDCLDGTDEIDATILYHTLVAHLKCNINATFLCEERRCRYGHYFSCGDGDCIPLNTFVFFMQLCLSHRHVEITQVLLTSNDNVSNIACQQTLRCLIGISNNVSDSCSISMSNNFDVSLCESLSTHCFSEWVVIPQQPILFGFFQFLYATNRSISEFETNVLPNFVCFNPRRCPGLLPMNVSIKLINGLTCCHIYDLITVKSTSNFYDIESYFENVVRRCLTIGTELSCPHSSLFHCPQSLKCISYHRLVDGFKDCYYGEDELYPACQLNDSSRFVCLSNSSICLSTVALGNISPECPKEEDEMSSTDRFRLQQPPFSHLCNSRKEVDFEFGEKMDEEYCEQWPCNTPYVRCDKRWHCLNGIDELNCPNLDCLPNEHQCQLTDDYSTICLSIEHFFDEYINECPPNQTKFQRNLYFNNRTNSNMSEYISWNKTKCITEDKICRRQSTVSYIDDEVCLFQNHEWSINKINTPLTNRTVKCFAHYAISTDHLIKFSSTSHLGFFPPAAGRVNSFRHIGMVSKTIPTINISPSWYCNRGILVQFRSNKTSLISTTIDKCLCPPSYFGSRCQWQNQRVSLTLKLLFRSSTLANIVFQVIVMLIDEDEQITSNHEQITFVPIRDCNTKFNIYLLYPDRPKRVSANYSVRIDIFRKTTLEYLASWHVSIPFQFLPVNRLAAQLLIPESCEIESCPLSCGNHGTCRQYANKKLLYFCQCDQGYSGTLCNITHTCHCSNDSICLSSSICVCPLYKFGAQCYLKHSTCQSSNNPCKNNGLCIPNDYRISGYEVTCLCPQDYSGETCEINNNRIDIQFDETIIKNSSSLFFHFITIFTDKDHERTTTFKKIPFDNNKITLYVQQPFNILFTESTNHNKTYYLTIVRETFISSENIHTQVRSNQRCSRIDELLNDTFLNYNISRRVKYYPMLCQQYRQLMCLYDEIYICVCDLDRFSNCFEFDHSLKYDCQGQNICKNNGQCFENNATCPTMTMCVCEECYYGTKCEFSTKGFFVSLDPILGYHIKPNVPIDRQPSVVKLSIAIITCMFVFGLISESLSIMTFCMKNTRQVGCGWYLLISSSVSLCLIIVLKIKFWILVLSQKALLTDRLFLTFSCIVTDGTLKSLLATNEWLDACVAIERMFTVLKGVSFNKSKSERIAKWISFIIPLLTVCTYLHDPLKRELIDDFDGDEKRIWCFVQSSPSLDTYNFAINLFHFLVPMLINFISALIIIASTARSRSTALSKLSFIKHFRQQLKHHKHLLLTPCLIILLSLPRLIIPFFSGCMKSPRNPLLFLIGYFISFVPVTLHFFIFVWPSEKYMDEFKKMVQHIKRRFRFNFMSS
jgi:hypothetical protein